MNATPPKRAIRALWLPGFTVACRDVEHCPVQLHGVPFREHPVCNGMQGLVITNIGFFGVNNEIPPQQPSHAGIHQGMWLAVNKQQDSICNVLPNSWHLFQHFTLLGPLFPENY